MRNIRRRIITVILLCAGFVPFVWAETKSEKSVERPPSTWELIRKSQTKQADSAKPTRVERVLHFPKERSLGELMIGQENPEDSSTSFGGYPFEKIRWERYGQAWGDVKIPKDKKVRLILDSWTWQNPQSLSALKQLQPDDIYSLTLSPQWSSGGRSPGDKCMPYVAYLTGLNTLNLDGANISTRGLKYLIVLKSLMRLKPPNGLNDSGMILIGKLRLLKVLYIGENNSVTDAGLKRLSNLKSLEILVLNSVRMTDKGLVVLCDVPLLRHLIIRGNFTSDAALYLKDVPSLKSLRIDMPRFDDRGMENISHLTQLENLSTHWVEDTTDRGIAYLKNMPSLKCLDIGHAKLTDRAMLDLNKIPTLEHLHLPNVGLTDEGLKHIGQLQNLRHLWVGCSSISPLTDESLRYVGQLKNLEVLSIGGAGLSDEAMKHIAKLTNLKRLSISRANQLTNKGLAELAELESLTNFSLGSDTRMSISGLKSLNLLKNLKVLSLRDIYQDNSVLDISGLTKLERLTLILHRQRKGSSIVSDSFRNEDWECLANLTGLKTLQISGVGIDDGIRHISGLTNLEYLNIICRGEKKITDEALKHLASMDRLYRLYIKDGHFTDKALDYLDELPSLSWLELTSDFAFSTKAIRDFQKKNPNVTKLRFIP